MENKNVSPGRLSGLPASNDLIASVLTAGVLIASIVVGSGAHRILAWLGVLLLAGTPLLWIFPVQHLKKHGLSPQGRPYFEATRLVDQGLFGVVRHPQYLAYMFLVTGFALLTQHTLVIALAVLSIAFFYRQAAAEERELSARYGEAYRTYCRRVPRFNLLLGVLRRVRPAKSA